MKKTLCFALILMLCFNLATFATVQHTCPSEYIRVVDDWVFCKKCYKTVQGKDAVKVFSDLERISWYVENGAIDYVYNTGLFNGVSEKQFAPVEGMSRGMFVTVLGRLEGITPDPKATTVFKDVKKGQYYTGYVQWASDAGIVEGVGKGKFAPDDTVTREQICKLMVGYCDYAGIQLKTDPRGIVFSDFEDIAPWAKEYVVRCLNAEIIDGIPSDTGYVFLPRERAARCQVATIFSNFQINYGN